LVAHAGSSRIFRVTADAVNVDRVLKKNEALLVGRLGLKEPRVKVPGSGFYPSESSESEWFRWLTQDGELSVTGTDKAALYRLETDAFSVNRPRTITLFNERGVPLGSTVVSKARARATIGPFRLDSSSASLRLHVDPGPEQLGNGDSRVASVYLYPLRIEPIPDLTTK
jgi:hypothetical protein